MKKPAAAPIAPMPSRAPHRMGAAVRKVSGLFPSGLSVQKDWLKRVRIPHDKLKFRAATGLAPKAAAKLFHASCVWDPTADRRSAVL